MQAYQKQFFTIVVASWWDFSF